MAVKIIRARDFSIREDLDQEVIRLTGATTETKPDYLIRGTKIELEKLRLSDTRKVYGVSVEITDTPTQPREKNTADRGNLHRFGLNLE